MKKFLSIFLTVLLAVAIMTVAVFADETPDYSHIKTGITTDANGIYCTNLLDFNKDTNKLWAQQNTETGKWESALKWDQYGEYPTNDMGLITPVLHAYSSYAAHKWSLIEDGEVLHFESTDASIYPGIAFTIDVAQDKTFPIGRETNNPAKAEYAKIRVRNHSVCDQITFGFVLQNTNNGKFVQATITDLGKGDNGRRE